MNLHTRSICDACHDALATIERRGCWLCPSCDGSTISFPVTSVSCADVNAPAAALSPTVAGATLLQNNSECGERYASSGYDPGPSLATGMSSDTANAGGEHETVTALSLRKSFEKYDAETGTSPGACGTERGRVGALNPVAKATKGKAGTAVVTGHVRRSTTGTGLRVGEAVAVRPATSEFMDVTAGETAPNSVSDGVPFSSPPEMEPSVTSALAPSGSGSRKGGRQTVAAASPPASQDAAAAVDPGPCGWASTDLESALASETMADDGHWPATADPADPVVVDFEAEVAALEAQWRRDGISMNATTFFNAAINSTGNGASA